MVTFVMFKWHALLHYKKISAIYWMTLVFDGFIRTNHNAVTATAWFQRRCDKLTLKSRCYVSSALKPSCVDVAYPLEKMPRPKHIFEVCKFYRPKAYLLNSAAYIVQHARDYRNCP